METRKRSRAAAHPPRNNITTSELSSDIVFFHILPRLPVKSLSRFKCVSKQWHSFLTTSDFRKMHLHHHHVSSTKKMVVLSATKPYKLHTIDCERPNDGFTTGRPLPFKLRPRQEVRILTSVHGLVCIGIITIQYHRADNGMSYYTDLILWNPETGDHKTLCQPSFNSLEDREECYSTINSLFGLYHTPWDDDYKLLRVTRRPKVYIYSLKSDSWRNVESDFKRTREFPFYSIHGFFWVPSTTDHSLDDEENLYFLECTKDSYSIMRFNKKTETLKLMATPFLGDEKTTWLSFRVLRDRCIELWVNIESSPHLSRNELWKMGEDGDWTKVEESGTMLSDPVRYYHRLHLMRNGNKLLMYDGACVYQLDLKTHTKDLCSYTTQDMPAVSPGGKYIETMVSPNQYGK